MKTTLTFALLMLSSIMLYSAPINTVCIYKATTVESVSDVNVNEVPASEVENSKIDTDNYEGVNDQCSWNSRIELRGRLILERKYKLYT
jgi:hypothetical protein